MAHLFIVEKNVVKPNPETLLISPFSEIWERDTSEGKIKAIKEFTFIEFMSSKKKSNPYKGYNDEQRFDKLKEKYFSEIEDWKPDNLMEQGMATIQQFQREASPTLSYYEDALQAAENTRTFLKNIDLNERNDRTGNPLYKPKDVTTALIDTNRVVENLHALGEKVEQELFEEVKTRGNKSINIFEM